MISMFRRILGMATPRNADNRDEQPVWIAPDQVDEEAEHTRVQKAFLELKTALSEMTVGGLKIEVMDIQHDKVKLRVFLVDDNFGHIREAFRPIWLDVNSTLELRTMHELLNVRIDPSL